MSSARVFHCRRWTCARCHHNGNVSPFAFVDGVGAGANVTATAAAATGISLTAAATGIGINLGGTGISIQTTGGGRARHNMPPPRICNFIMRIL